MRDYKGYEIVKISGRVSEDKLKKAVRSGKISLSADELKGSKPVLVHPANAKMIKRAQSKGKGITSLMLTASDVLADFEHHGSKSVWRWLEGFKTRKAYNWIFLE